MHSPGTVGELQSRRYHGNSLLGLCKSKERRVKGRTASGVWKMSKGTRLKLNMSRRVTMDVEVDMQTGETYMLFESYICAMES